MASPPDTPLSPVSFDGDDDSKEPQAPDTAMSSSEEEDEVDLQDTNPFRTPSTTTFPGLGPQASIRRVGPQASIPRIGPQPVIPGVGSQQTVIPGIVLQAAIPQTMPKQETGVPSKTLKHDGDVKIPTATTVLTSKPLPSIGPSVTATRPESKEETSLSSTLAGQKPPPQFSDIPKSVQHTSGPTSERMVASNILPSNKSQSTPRAPIPNSFKFTLGLPVSHQPGHAPAEERFSFTQESKAPLGEVDFPPVRRPAAKTTRFSQPKEPTAPYYTPVKFSGLTSQGEASMAEASTLAPQDEQPFQERRIFPLKPSLPDAFTTMPQAKKPDEEPMFVPVKTSLAEPSTPTHQAKNPVEEPQLIPIKSPLAKLSVPMRQASQSTGPTPSPAAKSPVETGYKQPTAKDVGRREGPSDQKRQANQSTEPSQSPGAKPPVETGHKRPTTKDVGRQKGPPDQKRQASQSTDLPQSPAVKPPMEKEYKRPITKDVGRQDEGTTDAYKESHAQAIRQLMAEKRELRSQRDALAREKAGLETKLHSLNDVVKKVEDREEESKKAVSAKSKEVADLETENGRLKKEMEALSLMAAPKTEQDKSSRPARTEISEKSTLNEDLLAEKAKETDNLKDTIKQLTKKERDLKASTGTEVLELKAKLRKAEDDLTQKKKDEEYTSKRTERDSKIIKDLSDELTKVQLAKTRIETEFRAQTVKLNKAKTREAEAKSKEVLPEELEKLRQSLKQSEAEAKSAKEQAERFKKDLEASKDEIKSAKAQVDKLAKGPEESNGRTLKAMTSADPKLEIELPEAGQTPPNQPKETCKEEKQKIRALTADNEALRKELEEAKQLTLTGIVEETDGLKAANPPIQPETSEEDKQKFRNLTADNKALREELKKAEKKISDLSKEIDEFIVAANERFKQNTALAKTCQDLEKKVPAQTAKLQKLTAANEDLSRKLQKSEEVEERAIRKVKEIESIYEGVLPVHATNMEQAKQLDALRAKIAEATKARQKSESHANLLERKMAVQLNSLREVSKDRAELICKVGNQEAELAKYADARKSVKVEAELEVTKKMMEKERARLVEADAKRELNMKTTLETLEQNERERRQKLVEEVEAKTRLFFEAKEEIWELNQKLAASKEAAETVLAAAAAAPPSQSSQSSPSPVDPSLVSAQSSPPISSFSTPPTTTTTTGTMPWFQLQRFPTIHIQMNLSPRRLLIFLFILSIAFLGPYFHSQSLSRQTTEEREMWRAANEISRRGVVEFGGEGNSREAARVMANWDRQGRSVPAAEEEEGVGGWRWTKEAGRSSSSSDWGL